MEKKENGSWSLESAVSLLQGFGAGSWMYQGFQREKGQHGPNPERVAAFAELPMQLRDAFYVSGMLNYALYDEKSSAGGRSDWLSDLENVSPENREAALRLIVERRRWSSAQKVEISWLVWPIYYCLREGWDLDPKWVSDLRAAIQLGMRGWKEEVEEVLRHLDAGHVWRNDPLRGWHRADD